MRLTHIFSRTLLAITFCASLSTDLKAQAHTGSVRINGVAMQVQSFTANGEANELAHRWWRERLPDTGGQIQRHTDGKRIVLGYPARDRYYTVTFKPTSQSEKTEIILASQSLKQRSALLRSNADHPVVTNAHRIPFVPPGSFATLRIIEWESAPNRPRMFHLISSHSPSAAAPQLVESLRRAGWQIRFYSPLSKSRSPMAGVWVFASRGSEELTAMLFSESKGLSGVLVQVSTRNAP